MAVPKAAVHKNDCVVFWQHEVRLSRQFTVMQPKPETHSMKAAPDNHFGLGILRLDPGHHATADFAANNVNQGLQPIRGQGG